MELRRVPPGPDRRPLLPLLLLADDVAARYLDDGDLWVVDDPSGVAAVGAVLTIPVPGEVGVVELRNVAVAEAHQGRGTGRAMLAALVDALAAQGWRRAVVATGTADPRTYVFYQRCGFRPHHVERDVFTVGNGYDPERLREPNGLVHLDVLWLDREL